MKSRHVGSDLHAGYRLWTDCRRALLLCAWDFGLAKYLACWVFANPDTGKPYWPGRIQENWIVPAAEKVGIGRIGWHTFRHSHSSLLHALGVDLKDQQELLRHADTHAVPEALRKANSKVVRLVLPAQVA